MTKKNLKFPSLAGRVFFFPALVPLAAVMPWLLTVIGTVASIAGFSGGAFLRKHHLKFLGMAVICFTATISILIARMPDRIIRNQGTQATLTENLPVAHIVRSSSVSEPLSKKTQFGKIWSRRVNRQVLSTPVIAGDVLIFGSYQKSVEAISIQNGDRIWSLPQKEPVYALCLEEDGILYAGEGLHETTSAQLTAINPANGKPFWQRMFLGRIESPPALDKENNRLWVGTGPEGLWSLDSRDGRVLWHKKIGHIASTVAISGEKIYALAQPDEKIGKSILYKLDAEKGSTIWETSLMGKPWGNPIFDKTGKTIFTTTGMGQIGIKRSTDRGWAQALSAADGKILWQIVLPDMPIQPDVYLPDMNIMIYSLKNGELVAFNVENGETVWQVKVGEELQAAAVLLKGEGEPLVAVTTCDGIFSIRRAATGVEVARRMVPEGSTSSAPVSHNDIVYVMTAFSVTAFGGIHALREDF